MSSAQSVRQCLVTTGFTGKDHPYGIFENALERELDDRGHAKDAPLHLLHDQAPSINVNADLKGNKDALDEGRVVANVFYHGNKRLLVIGKEYLFDDNEMLYITTNYPGLLEDQGVGGAAAGHDLLRARDENSTLRANMDKAYKDLEEKNQVVNNLKADAKKNGNENTKLRKKNQALEASEKEALSENATLKEQLERMRSDTAKPSNK